MFCKTFPNLMHVAGNAYCVSTSKHCSFVYFNGMEEPAANLGSTTASQASTHAASKKEGSCISMHHIHKCMLTSRSAPSNLDNYLSQTYV